MKDLLDQVLEWKDELSQIGISDKSKIFNKNLTDLIEYKNMIELAHTILLSAITRKESRGAHYRTDFTEESVEYDKNTILFMDNNSLNINLEEILWN